MTGHNLTRHNSPTAWQRWVRQPQRVWIRKALFQIHLWSGIGFGLYIFFISVTGSVLVYRNELYMAATPDQRSGEQVPLGIRLVSTLIELHKEFLAGPTGRTLNGVGAVAVMLMVLTGLVIWWPGATRWRSSLTLHRNVGWRRFIWELHSMVGIWCFGIILMFALSGLYLCFPLSFHALADRIQPVTLDNNGERFVDSLLYWLAFLHFGRINGIGLPCAGPGLCDQSVKAVWALAGLVPAVMFVTGATMWWNRVLRRWLGRKPSASGNIG